MPLLIKVTKEVTINNPYPTRIFPKIPSSYMKTKAIKINKTALTKSQSKLVYTNLITVIPNKSSPSKKFNNG
jgi:hypothetical protein